jgi:hypothetical protein
MNFDAIEVICVDIVLVTTPFMRPPAFSAVATKGGGVTPGLGIDLDRRLDGHRRGRAAQRLQGGFDHIGDPGETDAPLQEGGDRDLVGGIEHAGGAGTGLEGLTGKAQTGETHGVGGLEIQAGELGEVERGHAAEPVFD